MLESFKTHQLHIAAGALGEVPSGQPSRPLQFQSEPDVIDYSPPGHQSEILKHYGAIAPRSRNRFSVDAYAPAGRLDQAGDGQQQTAFSAATWTHDRDEGSARDVEVYIGNRDECSCRLGFLINDSQALDLNVRGRLYDGASVH